MLFSQCLLKMSTVHALDGKGVLVAPEPLKLRKGGFHRDVLVDYTSMPHVSRDKTDDGVLFLNQSTSSTSHCVGHGERLELERTPSFGVLR